MSWQLTLLDRIHSAARSLDEIAELWVFGSAADPQSLDRWSDVDVGIVLTADLDLDPLVTSLGRLWVTESSSDDRDATYRLIFTDGRRLDLIIADHSALASRAGRQLELADRHTRAGSGTGRATLTVPSLDDDVRQARFLAALATVKIGRGDLLIGGHLTLELMQLCLVQAMLLRDADEGRASHRFGTARDKLAEEILQVARRPAGPDWIHVVRDLAAQFDRLYGERHLDYRPDWSGLQALGD